MRGHWHWSFVRRVWVRYLMLDRVIVGSGRAGTLGSAGRGEVTLESGAAESVVP